MPSYIAPVGLTRSYDVRPAAGLRFGNFEGVVHLPPVKNRAAIGPHSFSSLNNEHIYRTICQWVEAWQPWQQKIVLFSIINRFTVSQLEILATTLEPLRHRGYMAVSRQHWPFASRQPSPKSRESTVVLKSALKKLPKISTPEERLVQKLDETVENKTDSRGSEICSDKRNETPTDAFGDSANEGEKTAEKEPPGLTIDQYASLVTSSLLVAAIGEIALADKIERRVFAELQEKTEETAADTACVKTTGEGHDKEYVKKQVNETSSTSARETCSKQLPCTSDSRSTISDPNGLPVSATAASRVTGILRSETAGRERSRESRQISAQFLGGRISFTPQSRQSRRSEPPRTGSSRYRHSAFTSSAASTADFFQREKISVLGPMQREIRTGQVQRPIGLGAIPVSVQKMYKNRGWWPNAPPEGKRFQSAKKDELSSNFRDQQATILGWMHEWESHERLALLKEVAKVCRPGVLEALVAYIHQKLRDECDISRLPDKLLLYILSFLPPAHIRTCAQVCRRWRYLCAMDSLWIVKCLELGEEEGIENIPQLISAANKEHKDVDWMLAYTELHSLVAKMKQEEERLVKEEQASSRREAEERARAAADETSPTKRFGIRRWCKLSGGGSSSSLTDLQSDVDGQPQAAVEGKGSRPAEGSEVDSAFSEEDLTPFLQKEALSKQPKLSGKHAGLGRTHRRRLRSSVQHKIQETLSERTSPETGGTASQAQQSSKTGGSRQKSASKEKEEEEMALDIHTDLTQSKDLLGKVVPAMSLEWETPEHDEDFIRYPVYAGKVCTIQRVRKLQGHIGGILCLQFDQRRLFTGGVDHAVRLWDVRSGRSVHKFYGHKGGVRCLKFDGEILVTGSWDSVVMVWQIRQFCRRAVLHGHENSISCLALNKDFIISGSHDKTVRVWSRATYFCTLVLRGHAGPVLCLVADGEHVFSSSSDLTIRMSDFLTGQCVRVFERANSSILCLTMQESLLLGGDSEGRVYFWNTGSGEAEAAVKIHDAPINAIAYHNARFYTGSSDGTMTEYDLLTMTCLRVLRGHKAPVRALQVSDRRYVSCGDDGTIRIWDLHTSKTTSLSSVF